MQMFNKCCRFLDQQAKKNRNSVTVKAVSHQMQKRVTHLTASHFRGYKPSALRILTSLSEGTASSSALRRRLLGRQTSPCVITKVSHSQLMC